MKVIGKPIEVIALQEHARCVCGDEDAMRRLTVAGHEMDLGPVCLSGLHTLTHYAVLGYVPKDGGE